MWNRFKLWIVQGWIREQMLHGNQQQGITGIYSQVHATAREVFCEDNLPTLNEFLDECYQAAKPRT